MVDHRGRIVYLGVRVGGLGGDANVGAILGGADGDGQTDTPITTRRVKVSRACSH